MLTARVEESDRLRGLELGADLRRTQSSTLGGELVTLGELALDTVRQKVTRGEQVIELTTTEFQLLVTLARQPGTNIHARRIARRGAR
jgi:DNA-binding response OmpR family regulator